MEKNIFTEKKKDELLSLLAGYKTENHTFEDKGYNFLDVGQFFVTVKNPEKTIDLSVRIGNGFTLFFAGTQTEFEFTEEGFENLKHFMQSILNCSQCAYVLITSNGTRYSIGKVLSDKEINEKTLKNIINSCAAFKNVKLKNAKLRLIAWQTEYNKEACF